MASAVVQGFVAYFALMWACVSFWSQGFPLAPQLTRSSCCVYGGHCALHVLGTVTQFPEPSLREDFINEKTDAHRSKKPASPAQGPGSEGATFRVETGESSVDLVAKSARPLCAEMENMGAF